MTQAGGRVEGGSRKLRYVGQISTPSLLTNALRRPAIWAGPRGYSNIQSEEETEAATAAGGAQRPSVEVAAGRTIHYLILL